MKLKARGERMSEKYPRLFDSQEDAGQEYVTRLLEGKHQHATVDQAFIDMVRERANPRSENFLKQLSLALSMPTDPDLIKLSYRPFDVVNRRLFLEKAIGKLDRKARFVILKFLEGYTYEEIGAQLDVTTQRIQQIMTKSVDMMRSFAVRYK